VAAAWEMREPGTNRVPLPRAAFEAGLAVALVWEWYQFATFLLIGWCSAGRPGELLAVCRRAVLLPSDLGSRDDVAFVVFEAPKTGQQAHVRRAARRQHARIDAVEAVRWLEAYCAWIPDAELVVGLSKTELKRAWGAVFGDRLGFSTQHLSGITPSSLRAGSATALYQARDSPEPVRWRLRHTSQGMTERYIQESMAALILGRLPAASRATIVQLAAAAPVLLAEATVRASRARLPRSIRPRRARVETGSSDSASDGP